MMLSFRWIITLTVFLTCLHTGWSDEKKNELKVLYLGNVESERGKSYLSFLQDHFTNVAALPRKGFDLKKAENVDVVILDWAQSDKSELTEMPLGPKAAWNKPTVLLGSAGLLLATRWNLYGTLGCTCLEPFAYQLRDGPWADKPYRVDRQTVAVPTPDDFKSRIKAPTIDVIPMAKDEKREHHPGWCTYSEVFDSPDCEVLCGGINAKTPSAAAIWRHGHLLHYGFDLAPSEMTDRAQQLLINSIVYIARFTEDRPITDAPDRSLLRVSGDSITRRKDPDENYVKWFFGPELGKKALADWPAFQKWYQQNRDYMRAERSKEGALVIDEEAMAFGVPPGKPAFLPTAIAALKAGGTNADLAARLLQRYVKAGPAKAGAEEWAQWLNENQPYLFFSEASWYQWYIDLLAKKRKIPTEGFRGTARASK